MIYTQQELDALPTLHSGQFANLKVETTGDDGRPIRIWQSRGTIADGELDSFSVERLENGCWIDRTVGPGQLYMVQGQGMRNAVRDASGQMDQEGDVITRQQLAAMMLDLNPASARHGDDALQDAALKVLKYGPETIHPHAARSYLRRTLRSADVHISRRAWYLCKEGSVEALHTREPKPDADAELRDTRAEVVRAIEQLTPALRSSVEKVLRNVTDNSATGKVRRHRARKQMRETLGERWQS